MLKSEIKYKKNNIELYSQNKIIFKLLTYIAASIAGFILVLIYRSSSNTSTIDTSYIYVGLVTLSIFVITIIYYYLRFLPVDITSIQDMVHQKNALLKYQLEEITEIEGAINIHENNIKLLKSNEESKQEIIKYIKERAADLNLNITNYTLDEDVNLQLLKVSLNTKKSRIKDKLQKKDDHIKNMSQEDTEKDSSLIRMSKLNNIVTQRLRTEIALLSKRSDIYIVFGSSLTIIAGFVLFFTVQGILSIPIEKQGALPTPTVKQEVLPTPTVKQEVLPTPTVKQEVLKDNINITNNDTLTKHDILSLTTRFSIVIFIEVFAFYYFRLYRNIMENIKFYQNEITNIEMKLLALHAAEGINDPDALKVLSHELVKTERNFVIDKNKTTVDIERSKQDTNIFSSATENLVKLIKSIK
ncbi:hypothetical protein [Photobacterium kishitanii]|uniref:hypothetical protein n=1 Tax=Photobacterium kishitanii TaxID=318456 RepID=UPI000431F5FF|nr:hypothetical protein [Photobacterium kishitanii]CEO41956.1 membrane hypothetical protein. In SS9 not in 3TCK [Photobacterium kishitanii]